MSSKKKKKTKRKTKKVSITPDHRIDKVIEGHVEETSSWRIFKIIGEFVSGYEFLRNYPLGQGWFCRNYGRRPGCDGSGQSRRI